MSTTKRALFEIKQNAVGRYYFIFKDLSEKGLIVSKSFPDRSRLETCVAQIRATAIVAGVTEDPVNRIAPPLFIIKNENTGYTFTLIGFEGEIVFRSECFQNREDCIKSIAVLKNLSADAGILDSV